MRGFSNLTRKQLRKQQKLGLDKPIGQETKLVESDWKDAWTENLPKWAQKRKDYVDRIRAFAVHMIPVLTEDSSKTRTKTGRYWMQDKSDDESKRGRFHLVD
ncbi:hypothetical protein Pmar_PMAR019870 [Perkinsus marinus ATCC 50983]|uniref:Uncharacterized protein n=1 Tax=Perkinsus marinus (strain ATCC 50983 / TXsc) TaxID=423536 RepID=C5KBV7_PERM5|nr:hypothetical protein Pmar_PMAR019870 [Perkinsus marinus ATCC 50983]EER17988.1 hypothetical protein Pmar_PMAR019870 [Perkinsus marinus ATCC 50983]|eukprot:XP_002786192.1 hypothetical protein Pmar_PMAR019870 [Perkinsus marinus ATCC 50983]